MAGMKYKDIAAKYNVSIATVKSWKTRYKWDRKSMHTKSEKVCIQTQGNNAGKNEPIVDEVKDVLENTELTEKQRLFCIYFVRCFNATKAYKKAYKCDDYTAMASSSRLLRNVKVKKQIDELKQEKLNQSYLTDADIFQKYMDIAFADMNDYMEWHTEDAPLYDKAGNPVLNPNGSPVTRKVNRLLFKNSDGADGTIISEIKQGRNGVSIKLADRMKALDWLAKHKGMATPEQRARIDLLKEQLERTKTEDSTDMEINVHIDYGKGGDKDE